MTNLDIAITGVCAALYAVLAVQHILSRRPSARRTLFILSCAVLCAAMLSLALAIAAPGPEAALLRLRTFAALVFFSPAVLLPFFVFFGRETGGGALRARLPGMIVLAAALAAGAVLLPIAALVEMISFEPGGGFWEITVTRPGLILVVIALIANVLYLYAFENTYRSATVAARVSLKYPLLGIISSSVVNFVLASRILSLHEIGRDHLAAGAAGLLLFGVSMLYAGTRYPVFEIRTPVSRTARSTVSVTVAGVYLLAVALIAYISRRTGMPYDRFSLTVIGMFLFFLAVAVAVSGTARRRLRRFVNENFRPGSYNYRREWRRYAHLMASSPTVEELLSNTISSLCETVMVRRGLIWVDVHDGHAASFGPGDVGIDRGALRTLAGRFSGRGVVFPGSSRRSRPARRREDGDVPSWIGAVAGIGTADEPRGLIALGPKDFGARWTAEDAEFLSVIADQVVVALDNLVMEERLLESRQLESFNRLASFVIHDLKNTVGMLSLTAANARDNIEDRSFQADAIDTIERSIARMRALIDSLNAHRSPDAIARMPIDVAGIAAERIASLAPSAAEKRVSLVLDAPVRLEATADPDAMRRIVENLVLNGIEAVGTGGTVRVRLGTGGGGLAMSVEDDGPGFDPGYLAEGLFRAFRTTKTNGLGVGLVLCKSLVEAHGGTISAGNRDGGGAAVRVEIPAGG